MGKKRKKASAKDLTAVNGRENVFFDEDLDPVEVQMVPTDQLTLGDAELEEEFTKTLTSLDPNKPSKITHFNFKNGAFESRPNDKHMAFHVATEGVIWSTKERAERERLRRERADKERKENEDAEDHKDGDNASDGATDGVEDQKQSEDADQKQDDDAGADGDDTKNEEKEDDDEKAEDELEEDPASKSLVKNQFNFSDRASQTFNEPQRDRMVQTEPAPKSVFSQTASSSAIRDEYLKKLMKSKQQAAAEEENKRRKSGFGGHDEDENGKKDMASKQGGEHRIKHHDEGDALLHSAEMLRALKIMERVTVLNANASSYHDFRYWRPGDAKRGSFIQRLWTFFYDAEGDTHSTANKEQKGKGDLQSAGAAGSGSRVNGQTVTALEWNRQHLDLFAVGYGSYSFHEQRAGRICIFSLRSTAWPEKVIWCESGVMAMAFHPEEAYSSLLAVGHYDGSVGVYDIRHRDDSPIYSSESPETHHADPVWAVQWVTSQGDGGGNGNGGGGLRENLLFHSISSDSEVKLWRMSQNELGCETLRRLKTEEELPALCCCLDFHPQSDSLCLIGTEDGHLMECNNAYSEGPSRRYPAAHDMNVYAVKWNRFHPKLFLSASEDWTVKLWETESTEPAGGRTEGPGTAAGVASGSAAGGGPAASAPVITYDLGCAVQDVEWAPFSSTVFAAVTADGKVHVFDLDQNKNAPLVSETVSQRVKLTTVRFAVGFPVLIVGDETGHIFALKLSPNLWLDPVRHKDILKNPGPDMFENEQFAEQQQQKLSDVLRVTGTNVFDVVLHFSPKPAAKKKKARKPSRFTSPISAAKANAFGISVK